MAKHLRVHVLQTTANIGSGIEIYCCNFEEEEEEGGGGGGGQRTKDYVFLSFPTCGNETKTLLQQTRVLRPAHNHNRQSPSYPLYSSGTRWVLSGDSGNPLREL